MLYAKLDLSNTCARLQQAFADRDSARVAVLHAENALAMYPQPLPTLGREAIRQVWAGFFAAPDFRHPITVDEILESEQGDLGYTIGRWWLIQPIVRSTIHRRRSIIASRASCTPLRYLVKSSCSTW